MRGNIIKFLIIYLAFCMSGSLSAQSIYDMEGHKFASKLSENALNVTGSIFIIKDGKLIEFIDGQEREDLPINYFIQEDGRVKYFNSHNRYVGYLLLSENRYYQVNQGKTDEQIALLYNKEIYTIDEKPRYQIDNSFDPVWVGCILFFFLMTN